MGNFDFLSPGLPGSVPDPFGLPGDDTGDEIELWARTTSAAPGSAETLAALGLPAGSPVTSAEHPEKGTFAWLSDDQLPLAEWWPRLIRAWPTSGWWPMIVPVENEMLDLVRSGGLDGPCEVPDDYAAVTHFLVADLVPEDGTVPAEEQWKVADAPLATGTNPGKVLTTQYPVNEHLMLVPVARIADALAQIGWTGASAVDLDGGELSCALRSWEERFGAVVGEMCPESLMIDVAAPPADVAQQKLMLRELNAWCPDLFAEGSQEEWLEVVENSPWMVWWD